MAWVSTVKRGYVGSRALEYPQQYPQKNLKKRGTGGQGGPEIDRVGFSLDSVFIFLGISVAPKVSPVFEMLGNHSAFPREND